MKSILEEARSPRSRPRGEFWDSAFHPDVLNILCRLRQGMIENSGFIEVEVTKRSGDGGIDGYGTIRIGRLISFNVLFQSKRYPPPCEGAVMAKWQFDITAWND